MRDGLVMAGAWPRTSQWCVHRSSIACRNPEGDMWHFTDNAATKSNAFNYNICRADNPILVSWEFHSY